MAGLWVLVFRYFGEPSRGRCVHCCACSHEYTLTSTRFTQSLGAAAGKHYPANIGTCLATPGAQKVAPGRGFVTAAPRLAQNRSNNWTELLPLTAAIGMLFETTWK